MKIFLYPTITKQPNIICKVCKNKNVIDHTSCRFVKKFKCMCGCDRKYNLNQLKHLNRNPRDKIKCCKAKLVCTKCKNNTDILISCRKYCINSIDGVMLSNLCLSCVHKNWFGVWDIFEKNIVKPLNKFIMSLDEKIKKGEIIKRYYNNRYSPMKIRQFIENKTIDRNKLNYLHRESVDMYIKEPYNKFIREHYKRKIIKMKEDIEFNTGGSYIESSPHTYDSIKKAYSIIVNLKLIIEICKHYNISKGPMYIIMKMFLSDTNITKITTEWTLIDQVKNFEQEKVPSEIVMSEILIPDIIICIKKQVDKKYRIKKKEEEKRYEIIKNKQKKSLYRDRYKFNIEENFK